MALGGVAALAPGRGKTPVALAAGLLLLLLGTASAGAATFCQVNVPRVNLRERPFMGARIVGVLPGRSEIIVVGGCTAGWVRVVSEYGATRGYAVGWALREVTSSSPRASSKRGAAVAAALPGVPAKSLGGQANEASSPLPGSVLPRKSCPGEPGTSGYSTPASWVFHPEEGNWSYKSSKSGPAPANEAAAVQMTEDRLKVLDLERRVQQVERALAQLQGSRASGGYRQ